MNLLAPSGREAVRPTIGAQQEFYCADVGLTMKSEPSWLRTRSS